MLFIDIFLIYFWGWWGLVAKEGDARAAKRARLLVDESEDDEVEDDDQTVVKTESTFDDLWADTDAFCGEQSVSSESGIGGCGILDGHVLARIFHFLRADMKSLAFASLTCKHWRAAVRFYRDVSRQVDLSSLGPNCTDRIFVNIMVRFTFVFNCNIAGDHPFFPSLL